MFEIKVIFADPPDSPKAVAERYITAMYDKNLLEFACTLQLKAQASHAEEGKAPLSVYEAEQEES